MAEPKNKFLEKMLERLYGAMASGPSLNCRPHNSRQRIDLHALRCLSGPTPEEALASLLGDSRSARWTAPLAGRHLEQLSEEQQRALSPEQRAERRAIAEQQALLRKLSSIADDAQSFEEQTGAQVLFLGLPVLSLPPGCDKAAGNLTRRILAPLAFVPVTLAVKRGRAAGVELACCGEGIDRVLPNAALLAWAEAQSGQKLRDLFADEEGSDPWREIAELAGSVCKAIDLPVPGQLGPGLATTAMPRADDEEAKDARLLPSAVLGLFPLTNQSLVRDLEALVEGEAHEGPIESFVKAEASLARPADQTASPQVDGRRVVAEERLVSQADPCQARAVRLSRSSRGLVVHGPPGTGKSQTIANAIGDHLARGERVLLVCDKRTALDVVKYRLEALGLGSLCAVIHDPQRDQKDLYLGVRDQLEGLAETKTNEAAVAELSAVDRELTTLHEELTRHDAALSARPGGVEPSFHELAGEWLATEVAPELASATGRLETTRLAELAPREREVRETLERAGREEWTVNSWRQALGLELAAWLARPMDEWRAAAGRLVERAGRADDTGGPEIPPFAPGVDLEAQGRAREELAREIQSLAGSGGSEELARWAKLPAAQLAAADAELKALAPQVEILESGPLDSELALATRSAPPTMAALLPWVARLDAWLAVARRWYGFLFLFRRFKAASVLAQFGLTFSLLAVERVSRFLAGLRARMLLKDFEQRLLPGTSEAELTDEQLGKRTAHQAAAFAILARIDTDPALAPSAQWLRQALADPAFHAVLIEGLRQSGPRSVAAAALLREVRESGIFNAAWTAELDAGLRSGNEVLRSFEALRARVGSVEGLLRVEGALASLPKALGEALRALLDRGAEAEAGWRALRKAVLAAELGERLRSEPRLQSFDASRLEAAHRRYRALDERKRALVREAILHLWTVRQRERLLAATGTRLNGPGAELKRRLMVRGRRVLKVRQLVAAGAGTEGGDPLFDLRPVWMASPETVAQIFPRQPLFDVVIFDESSQLRLEEALPVLTRGKRVVIAGDPKQLPPTRFFESAVSQSGAEEEPESDQALFEEQQSEAEDLLSAALNLEIEQAYLDVHYRSQNSDLIEFSNRSFYGSRLQAIPGHPSNRTRVAPLRLVRVNGTYEKRVNAREAEEVVSIVRGLLAQQNPPSVGIACFNLSQRDAISEALEEAAAADAAFASKLAEARARRGPASFEGLFVKNLENVQGDERDHIIISTTYGPDSKGRFYRRFGPLGQAGGGRRLNVLVTRARQAVHLVTSIPREQWAGLPPLQPGQEPSGGWLLFDYLRSAEQLERLYAEEYDRCGQARAAAAPEVRSFETPSPSAFAQALARSLAVEHGVSSDVHWGNEGFCVDVALRHPTRAEDVTLGVLCDGTRFSKAPDRVEWDLFRTAVLEGQGWKLLRLWTPQFFRDPQSAVQTVLADAAKLVAQAPYATPEPRAGGKAAAERMLN